VVVVVVVVALLLMLNVGSWVVKFQVGLSTLAFIYQKDLWLDRWIIIISVSHSDIKYIT
jgi:hypothetical protein